MSQFFQWLADLFQGAKLWAVVLPWEQAVCVRLGRWPRQWGPGIHFRVPFLDQVRVMNTRLRIASIPAVTITTKDYKTVTVSGYVGFQIDDPLQALLSVQQPEEAVSALAMTALSEHIATQRVEELKLEDLGITALGSLHGTPFLKGMRFVFVKVVDFAVVKTYRLLQEQWRPSTSLTNFEPPS